MYTHHRQDIVRYVPPHEIRLVILFVVIHPNSTLKCSCMLECLLFLGKITFLWNYEGKSINQPQIGIFKKYIRCKACIIAFTLSIFFSTSFPLVLTHLSHCLINASKFALYKSLNCLHQIFASFSTSSFAKVSGRLLAKAATKPDVADTQGHLLKLPILLAILS